MARLPSGMSRRSFLSAGAAVGLALPLAAACGTSDESGSDTAPGSTGTDGGHGHEGLVGEGTGAPIITAVFDRNAYAVTGAPQRLPLAIRSGDGVPETGGPEQLEVRVRRDGSDLGEPLVIARHAAGVPLPFYPVRTTFPEPGLYELVTELEGAGQSVPFQVGAPGSTGLLAIGDTLPPQATPTFDDALGVEPICTRFPDPCPLHDISLVEAEGEGRPIVLMVGTPAYCHIGVCGPVLELLLEAMPAHPEATYLHAEVYRDAEEVGVARAIPTSVMGALGLTFEPSLWVADAQGVVLERLDFVFDRTEIDEALALVG